MTTTVSLPLAYLDVKQKHNCPICWFSLMYGQAAGTRAKLHPRLSVMVRCIIAPQVKMSAVRCKIGTKSYRLPPLYWVHEPCAFVLLVIRHNLLGASLWNTERTMFRISTIPASCILDPMGYGPLHTPHIGFTG